MSKPWEMMDLSEDFDSLPAEQQVEELSAAVGLLVEFAGEAIRHPGATFPLMPEALATMGRRYGPWSR